MIVLAYILGALAFFCAGVFAGVALMRRVVRNLAEKFLAARVVADANSELLRRDGYGGVPVYVPPKPERFS